MANYCNYEIKIISKNKEKMNFICNYIENNSMGMNIHKKVLSGIIIRGCCKWSIENCFNSNYNNYQLQDFTKDNTTLIECYSCSDESEFCAHHLFANGKELFKQEKIYWEILDDEELEEETLLRYNDYFNVSISNYSQIKKVLEVFK